MHHYSVRDNLIPQFNLSQKICARSQDQIFKMLNDTTGLFAFYNSYKNSNEATEQSQSSVKNLRVLSTNSSSSTIWPSEDNRNRYLTSWHVVRLGSWINDVIDCLNMQNVWCNYVRHRGFQYAHYMQYIYSYRKEVSTVSINAHKQAKNVRNATKVHLTGKPVAVWSWKNRSVKQENRRLTSLLQCVATVFLG